MTTPTPMVPFLEIPDGGEPRLVGCRCRDCAAVFTDARTHCAACGAREALERVTLASRGILVAYTVVYRSFPEVAVPYVSAVVDLDAGGTLKGNLVDAGADPSAIAVGMPVETVYRTAAEADDAGNPVLTYAFRPVEASS